MDNNYDSLNDTLKHRENVLNFISIINDELIERSKLHDQSKMEEFEKPIFDEFTPKLANCTYGSEEYKKFLSDMDVALKHHYEHNMHHPEFYKNGIKDMTLVDIIEMLCDWKAATLRHNDGDILKSIEYNQKRFGYTDELKQIFLNTVKEYF